MPNPGKHYFSLRLKEKTTGIFEVYSASGIKMLERRINEENEISLNLKPYESGIYLVRLISADGRSTVKKLIKLRD